MKIQSINPATGKVHKEFKMLNTRDIPVKIDASHQAFQSWKLTSFLERKKVFINAAELLRSRKESLARIMSLEIGKRLVEGIAEIEKCAWVCEYYAENTEAMVQDEIRKTEAKQSYLVFEPLGVVLAVMPWNFPFWQVFRAAAPALMMGNTMLLKHASSVPESALAIEALLIDAGLPADIFQTLLIPSANVAMIIEDHRVRMLSFTGSEEAGRSVASLAGKNIKKIVMELGGSDPFIVLDDADIKAAAETAAISRMIVSGQSCISAKRFIVHKKVAEQFLILFKEQLESKQVGDPLDETTGVGPLSSENAVSVLNDQVQRSVAMGAKILLGGKKANREGYYYLPTILTKVTEDMPVMSEETFGPVAAVAVVTSDEEALRIANNSRFGLGASVWTQNEKRAKYFIRGLQAGGVFVNSMVKSDPRMPFGGLKFSGYGRELSEYGLKEFANLKSVWIE